MHVSLIIVRERYNMFEMCVKPLVEFLTCIEHDALFILGCEALRVFRTN